jgi:predicted membrane channel-forming protein YqfA (hemolysin III family)
MSVLVFCADVIIWCLLSLVYRILNALQGNDAVKLQKLEFGVALVLIWYTAIPLAVLLFRSQPFFQLGYLSAFGCDMRLVLIRNQAASSELSPRCLCGRPI